jgi:transposase InsO family protein
MHLNLAHWGSRSEHGHLGVIVHERIQPGRPQQNGRQERMLRTLKEDTTQPPALTLRLQQRKFDRFRQMFNHERPHEGLNNETPGSLY